ncbi:MAG: hypothetical protein K1X88_01500 [Nannocystaceae bacterium]|nr:hypothetical protein [Nannocystaceae bacterium]
MIRTSRFATAVTLLVLACDPATAPDGEVAAVELDDADEPLRVDAPANAPPSVPPTADVDVAAPSDPFADTPVCVAYSKATNNTVKGQSCKTLTGPKIPPQWLVALEDLALDAADADCGSYGTDTQDGGAARCSSVCSGAGKVWIDGPGIDTCILGVETSVSAPQWKSAPLAVCSEGMGQYTGSATASATCGCQCQ